jgi:hypothetical protein
MGIADESISVIRVRILRLQPLAGTASTEDGAEFVFEGWMELIGAVANLIGSPHRADIVPEEAATPITGTELMTGTDGTRS